ncbi:hypothetical protein AJ79_09576 [Helicocarpus griseus UAMH5409]|uniref:NACHT domain-containing protein n=1 Tax=Helicocarpus griseus UAMH5409 TaxID=1447875 RepID=A0A2B7WIN5_9EURO|nr:hypothetical protein AJ79_09576 [Helicocarpus griseus UAMH5409]
MAYQVAQNDQIYEEYVASSCQSSEDITTISSAWRALVDSSAYLVVDGVDKAFDSDRQDFFELLSDLKQTTSGGKSRLQIVLVGQPQISDELAVALGEYPRTISVDRYKNNQDIARYVDNSIKKSPILSRTAKSFRDEISRTLVGNAEGMFMWVNLMLRELSTKNRPSSIRDTLHKAPKGLRNA